MPLWGSHTSSSLLKNYEEIVNAFGIKNKIIRIVTDSAANNISAFQDMIIPGFERYFAEDDDDEINNDDDSDTDIDDGQASDEYEYSSDFSLSTATSLTSANLTLEDLIQESFNRLMENNEVFRIPCFAHSLQLVVKDGLQETKTILTALEKVSLIAKLAHTSLKFAEKLDSMKLSIPRAVITRWNSQFMCVERVLAIPSAELNDILVQLKYKNLCINTRDISMLQEFVALLSLFAEATTATQRQNSPSISLVAPSILSIFFDLINEKKKLQYTSALCDALLSSLLSRFGGLLEQMEIDINGLDVNFQMNKKFYDLYKDPLFLFSPFLDGMFKIRWITESMLPESTKERLCEKIKRLIFDHCVIIEGVIQTPVPLDTNSAETHEDGPGASSSSSTTPKRKFLFANIENDIKIGKKTKVINSYDYIKEEISKYVNDDNNNSMILINSASSASYKTLAKLAVKYLCIPATSASVERTFSQSGFLFRPHRARMSRKTLQQLTLLKCNNDIV